MASSVVTVIWGVTVTSTSCPEGTKIISFLSRSSCNDTWLHLDGAWPHDGLVTVVVEQQGDARALQEKLNPCQKTHLCWTYLESPWSHGRKSLCQQEETFRSPCHWWFRVLPEQTFSVVCHHSLEYQDGNLPANTMFLWSSIFQFPTSGFTKVQTPVSVPTKGYNW